MSLRSTRSACLWAIPVLLLAALTPLPVAAQPDFFGDSPPVRARAVAQRDVVRPGDPLVIAVELDHDAGFHTWPNTPVVPPQFGADFPAIATTVQVTAVPRGTVVHPLQWPEPVAVIVYYTLEPIELLSYAGTMVAFVPVTLAPDLEPGAASFELTVEFQACDETSCYPPQELVLAVPVTIAAPGSPVGGSANEPALFATFDVAGFTDGWSAPAVQPLEMAAFGVGFTFDPTGFGGLAALLALAAFGGLLLNFTPCVLPVIPLKVMGLSRAAGRPTRLLFLGAMMSLGVVAFWLAIGGAIAFIAGFGAISSLFQTGWFSFVVGMVVAVMAVGMFGLFEVTLPQSVYRVRPDQENAHGSFLFGVLTAVLSTPCTAPFMGAAAAWAATQAAPVTLATFASIGAGMALPYLLLTARPGLLARVPRSGPASVVVKQTMGFMMLAVASFFLGLSLASALQRPPDPPSTVYWWVVAFWVVVGAAWVAVRTHALSRSKARRGAAWVGAIALAGVSLALARGFASAGPIDWVHYTPERFTAAATEGHVIVLDFTAEWCLNCRALETGVLHQPRVVELLAAPGVVPMRVDLTGRNPDGQAKLKELQWVGIPLLAVFGPGTGYSNPLTYDTYTQQVVVDAVALAGAVGDG